jgi:hypothetical protein
MGQQRTKVRGLLWYSCIEGGAPDDGGDPIEASGAFFGLAAAFGYAVLAYGLFFWLDKEASDEAKAALARTMSLKDYKSEQVASALVEVFDRIYTYPLLRWRAFLRSLLFTTIVSAIWLYEVLARFPTAFSRPLIFLVAFSLSFNFITDYVSLFVIRPLPIRSGTKPVIGLALGAVSGAAIVLGANLLRVVALPLICGLFSTPRCLIVWCDATTFFGLPRGTIESSQHWIIFLISNASMFWSWPALAVFVWLPLFALGIVIARLFTPLSWMVGRTRGS